MASTRISGFVRPLRRSATNFHNPTSVRQHFRRRFHASAPFGVVKPYLLADIGEGITECQIIQWFVQPGARVAQFDKICEVQSDKAAVEITSRFDGVIKKLHYEADDMAKVGSPLVDIDIQGDIAEEDAALTGTPSEKKVEEQKQGERRQDTPSVLNRSAQMEAPESTLEKPVETAQKAEKHGTLATPAVRHLTKELDINIADVSGTGKDGRVLKEDVQKYASSKEAASTTPAPKLSGDLDALAEDKTIKLSPIQKKMYQTMTHSLTIPHFLYSDTVEFTSLSRIRRALNAQATLSQDNPKLSALPFIIKAVSLALARFPSLNAHLHTSSESPTFTHRASHNIGFAVDSPQGLMVPVVRSVQSHSITSLAAEINRLADLARTNKLAAHDLSGATFSVSNIGAIGGLTVAPVIVSPQVAILGVGKARMVPALAEDGSIVPKEESVFSWSADHRVVDGATVARCADLVRQYLEDMEKMLIRLR